MDRVIAAHINVCVSQPDSRGEDLANQRNLALYRDVLHQYARRSYQL